MINSKFGDNQDSNNNNRASKGLFDDNRRTIHQMDNLNQVFQFRGSNSQVYTINPDNSYDQIARASRGDNFTNKESDENLKLPLDTEREEFDFTDNFISLTNKRYTYHGLVEYGLRSGFGICESNNGEKYIGFFRRDKRHGMGKLFTKNGESYEGEFKNGRPDGFIIYTSSEGIIHKGVMKNYIFLNNTNLEIKYKDQDIEITLSSDFNASCGAECGSNMIVGIGKILVGNKVIYEGEIIDYKMNGYGISIKNNTVFQGHRSEKMFNGYCEIFYRDGTKYSGFFKNNKKHGLGCFISKDCVVNLCTYDDNFRHGGSFTWKIQQENTNFFIFENWLYGFKGRKIDTKEEIEKYIPIVFPEYTSLTKIDHQVLTLYLKKIEPLVHV